MSRVRDTMWRLEPHTAAKHEILRRYLKAWFPILGRRHPRLVFVDGFCGPGRYAGGEDGSPLVALEVAGSLVDAIRAEPEFVFIDECADRMAHLRSELSAVGWNDRFRITTLEGPFAREFPSVLDRIGPPGPATPPLFVFIDPFGFAGVPFDLVRRTLAYRSAEALVHLDTDSLRRFLTHPNAHIRDHMVERFGTREVLGIEDHTGDRVRALRELYQSQIRQHARFVRYFEMLDESGVDIYHLFFASNSERGFEKMKDAMWAVDPQGTFRFSDKTDPNQAILMGPDPGGELLTAVLERFAGRTVDAREVKAWVVAETIYRKPHLTAALRMAESGGAIAVDQLRRDGSRRKRGTYPDGTIVTFPGDAAQR